jgi:hypothetical protein
MSLDCDAARCSLDLGGVRMLTQFAKQVCNSTPTTGLLLGWHDEYGHPPSRVPQFEANGSTHVVPAPPTVPGLPAVR